MKAGFSRPTVVGDLIEDHASVKSVGRHSHVKGDNQMLFSQEMLEAAHILAGGFLRMKTK
jgi:hypothetical protein